TTTVSVHALTIGVIGTMTIGMMARVTLGHTGRVITAPAIITMAFIAMNLAALARLVAYLLPYQYLTYTWLAAGSFFVLAYLFFLIFAWHPLTSARPDGKAG